MKQLLFLSALILGCHKIEAQKSFAKKMISTNSNDSVPYKLKLVTLNDHALNYPQGKFLYRTEKGKVYALPPDNMLCLVPEYHSKMEILSSRDAFAEPMPNPLPKVEMIPKH